MSHDQLNIDGIINGDDHAFVELVEHYKNMVFTLALRILKNREEAEEVAQDVFLKVHGSLSSFQGDSKFSTWIYAIAYNKSLDYLKKRNRRPIISSFDGFSELNKAQEASILDELTGIEDRRQIKKALAELPSEDGILITLHYYEELSLKEISQIMGSSPGTLKVRLFRARKKLADILKLRLEPEMIYGYGKKKG
jgi:RNA polymerase sigma-70 factor (ECF subfamily)